MRYFPVRFRPASTAAARPPAHSASIAAHSASGVPSPVGAMLVGRIENLPVTGPVVRGQEKGYFAFGGSTVILITKKDAVLPDGPFAAADGEELFVRQGQRVGTVTATK